MASLKENVQNKIISSLTSVPGWKILVVDSEALGVIDASCRMSQVLESGVTVVESLSKKRQPNRNKTAVYFISNTLRSINQAIQDWEEEGEEMYESCHVFCLAGLSDGLFEKIRAARIKNYLKALIELNIDFQALDPNSFSLETPYSFSNIFNTDRKALLSYEIEIMAQKIVSVLVNLNEYPYIRYHSRPQLFASTPEKTLSFNLATQVQLQLDALCRSDPNFPPQSSRERGVLVICDRCIDIPVLLLHDLHYQSMLGDLYGLFLSKFTDMNTRKPVVLDQNDLFWRKIRTWHISEAMEHVAFEFERFKKENAGAKWQADGGQGANLEQLKEVISSFGDYTLMKDLVSRHQNLCLTVSKIFEQRGLENCVEVEQALAGNWKPKKGEKDIAERVREILKDDLVEYLDKVRILFLYVIFKSGVSDSERHELSALMDLEKEELGALVGLGSLGVSLNAKYGDSIGGGTNSIVDSVTSSVSLLWSKNGSKDGESITRDDPYSYLSVKKRVDHTERENKKIKFENDKYTPVLSAIMEDAINGKLDQTFFPFLKPPADAEEEEIKTPVKKLGSSSPYTGYVPTLGASKIKKPSWAIRKPQSTTAASPVSPSLVQSPAIVTFDSNTSRTIIFVIGGMTYSEMRYASEWEEKSGQECLIGSSHIWTPDSFIQGLKTLSSSFSNSRLNSENGKNKSETSEMKFYGWTRNLDKKRVGKRDASGIPVRPIKKAQNIPLPPRPNQVRRVSSGIDDGGSPSKQLPPRPELASESVKSPGKSGPLAAFGKMKFFGTAQSNNPSIVTGNDS